MTSKPPGRHQQLSEDCPVAGSLLDKFNRRVWAYLKRRFPSLCHEDIQEIWNDIERKLYEGVRNGTQPPFYDSKHVSNYVFKIAHNCAVDRLREQKKKVDLNSGCDDLSFVADSDLGAGFRRHAITPYDVLIGKEAEQIICEEIARLPVRERLVLEVSISIETDPDGRGRNLYEEVKVKCDARNVVCPSNSQVYALRTRVRNQLKNRLRIRGVLSDNELQR